MRVKYFFLLILFVFTSCSSFNKLNSSLNKAFNGKVVYNGYKGYTHSAYYETADPLEYFGLNGEVYEDRLYEVKAGGNAYTSRSEVKGYAMWTAGKAAYDNGYSYFSILIEDGKIQTSLRSNSYGNQYGITTNTYEVEKHQVILIILLLNEEDLETADNIYSTDKYYWLGSSL